MLKRLAIGLILSMGLLASCDASDIALFERVTGTTVSVEQRAAVERHVDSRVAAGEDRDRIEHELAVAVAASLMPQTTKRLSPSQARELGRRLVAQRGWGEDQFACLDRLWGGKESGWRWWADNPHSSAYGIPQALPGHKMGPGWQDDVAVQENWGLDYIGSRYKTPCAALRFHDSKGWY